MKIYWVSSDAFPRCFFRLSMKDAQEEVDWRMEEKKNLLDVLGFQKRKDIYGNWFIEEEELPDTAFGRCRNGDEPRLPYQSDCSVGSIRKLRSGVSDECDNGKCGTCPYFIEANP